MSRPPSSGWCSEGLEKNQRLNKHKTGNRHSFAAAGRLSNPETWLGRVGYPQRCAFGDVSLQCGLAIGLRLCPEISGLFSKSQEACPSKCVAKIWEPLGLGQVR